MYDINYTKKEYEPDQEQWERWTEYMYQLAPKPPKMELDEYIEKYKATDNFLYFRFFLHYYENRLNGEVERICRIYGQKHNFEDIKQTIVITLIKLIPKYNPELGVPFLSFAKVYVTAAIRRYIRKYGSCYSVKNDNHFRELRKANGIYYKDPEKSAKERLAETVSQMGKSEKDVRDLLIEGEHFRYYDSIYVDLEDDLGEPYFEEWVIDEYSQPETIVPNLMLSDDMLEAVEKLMHRPRAILLRRLGILCLYCGRTGERISKEEIANHFELYSDSAVDRTLNKATAELAKVLTTKGWFRAMHIKRESQTVIKGKTIGTTYSYRPMFGADEGLLEFNLTKPAEKGYIIDRFTPWDKEYPFFRHLVREVAKMQEKGEYVKERLLVWWNI